MEHLSLLFLANSVLLGIGLSMDAFSVSIADGLCEPAMPRSRMAAIASVFAFFQALMPMAGWICVHTLIKRFQALERYVPVIALALLLFLGTRMLADGARNRKDNAQCPLHKGLWSVLLQGVATSMDALSAGLAIASYSLSLALVCSIMIAATTFGISLFGLALGKRCALRLRSKAAVFGGLILILIGLEVFLKGIL